MALCLLDRGDIRQAIDRCSNIWASAGAGYGQFEHKADSLIAKFKEAGGTVRRLMYEQSHRDYLALVICIIVCLSWAVNRYRDNAITTTKPSATKMPRELKLANAAITDMQMRQRDVAALDAKYTKELAGAKAENDALRDDVAAGRRRLHIKAVCQSVRDHHRLRHGWIMQPPRLANLWTGLFHPQREADHYAKTTGRTEHINEQCR